MNEPLRDALASLHCEVPALLRQTLERLGTDEETRTLWDDIVGLAFEPTGLGLIIPPLEPATLYLGRDAIAVEVVLFVYPGPEPVVGFAEWDHGLDWVATSTKEFLGGRLQSALELAEDDPASPYGADAVHALADRLGVEPTTPDAEPPPAFARIHGPDAENAPRRDDEPEAFRTALSDSRSRMAASPQDAERRLVALLARNPEDEAVLETLRHVYETLGWPLHRRNVEAQLDKVDERRRDRAERRQRIIDREQQRHLRPGPDAIAGFTLEKFDDECTSVLGAARRAAVVDGQAVLEPEDVVRALMKLHLAEDLDAGTRDLDGLRQAIIEHRNNRRRPNEPTELTLHPRLIEVLGRANRRADGPDSVRLQTLYDELLEAL